MSSNKPHINYGKSGGRGRGVAARRSRSSGGKREKGRSLLSGGSIHGASSRSAPVTPLKTYAVENKAQPHPVDSDNHIKRRRFLPDSTVNYTLTPLREGQKGASSHTVSEEYRIQLTQLLMNLRETDQEDSITLPANLTNTARKFVHELAKKLGLSSKSYGTGENRKVVVSKVKSDNGLFFNGGRTVLESVTGTNNEDDGNSYLMKELYKNIPSIKVGSMGERALENHLKNFPPNEKEKAESKETGSSLLIDVNGSLETHSIDSNGLKISTEMVTESVPTQPSLDNISKPLLPQKTLKLIHDKVLRQRIQNHKVKQKSMKSNPNYKEIMRQRQTLPAFSYAKDICNILRNKKNQVVILTGDTGCGKTTQVPQFLLDDPIIGPTCNIIITQPRRISAISVAERVATERCEAAGETVGYSVRLESSITKYTRLLFVTPGVLLKKLHAEDTDIVETVGHSDRLAEYTHIVLDEIHERDRNTEISMIALKDVLEERDDLQLILMSATMPTQDLAEFWRGVGRNRQNIRKVKASFIEESKNQTSDLITDEKDDLTDDTAMAPVEINIPGRTFPVQEYFLEDVLAVTDFMNGKDGVETTNMAQIERDLMSLLIEQKESMKKSNITKNTNRRNKNIDLGSFSLTQLENTLTCVMCNQSGFRSAEEFGTHMATCDGGGALSMKALEEKVRSIDVSHILGFDDMMTSTVAEKNYDIVSDVEDDVIETAEEEVKDNNEDEPGLLPDGTWNAESPLIVDITGSSIKSTLDENEALAKYQTMFDDEEINFDLILKLLQYIVKSSFGDGAILIFFPGWAEISEFALLLEITFPFNDTNRFLSLPLHSGISSIDQRKVFQRPHSGVRKIVLATNIAETSLTIEDVAFVIDTGRAKEKNYDPHLKTSTLEESWISQASARQRKGRAGRCKAGVCFHLFSRRRLSGMRPFMESELLRTPLEEICLLCKRLKLAPGGPDEPSGIPSFLSKALSPPHPKSVMNALELLVELGAMDNDTNDLTDLGYCLSGLSLEPRVGKMVIMSHLLGCTKSSVSMAVAMSYKSPFALPPPSLRKASDAAKINFSEGLESDQITNLNVLKARDVVNKRGINYLRRWCRENYLNYSALSMISDLRMNASRELESLGFPQSTSRGSHNRNEDNPIVAFRQAAICAGLYPNIAFRRAGDLNYSTRSNAKAKIHLSSVNAIKTQPLSKKCQVAENEVEFVLYGELLRGKVMFTLENTTHLVSPLPLILLCGQLRVRPILFSPKDVSKIEDNVTQKALLSVDDWLVFICDANVAEALVVLRQRLDPMLSMMTCTPSNYNSFLSAEQKSALETLDAVIISGFNSRQN